MSEFIQDQEQLLEAMSGKVDPFILPALQGEQHTYIAESQSVIYGSDTLNAYIRACHLLRANPSAELSTEIIKITDRVSTLGEYLVDLVNDSLRRDKTSTYVFKSKRRHHWVDMCHEAEGGFKVAIQQYTNEAEELTTEDYTTNNRLYVDDEGHPVFLKKGYGVSSALSLEDIALNGIAYPAGTLFGVKKSRFAKGHRAADLTYVHSIEDIVGLAPLRPTMYALPEQERIASMTDTAGYTLHGTAYAQQVLPSPESCDIGVLKRQLPADYKLEEIVCELPKPSRYNEPACVLKPASVI